MFGRGARSIPPLATAVDPDEADHAKSPELGGVEVTPREGDARGSFVSRRSARW